MKPWPSAATRSADRPPNSFAGDSSTSPPRNSSAPKRLSCVLRGSNASIAWARISMRCTLPSRGGCALAGISASARIASKAQMRETMIFKAKLPDHVTAARTGGGYSSMQFAHRPPHRTHDHVFGGVLFEQLGELLGHRAAQFLGVDDGDGATIVPRHVMADADRDQLDRRAGLDLLDPPAQMALQIVARIDRQRGVVDRRAVGDHHQDLALLGAGQQALVR